MTNILFFTLLNLIIFNLIIFLIFNTFFFVLIVFLIVFFFITFIILIVYIFFFIMIICFLFTTRTTCIAACYYHFRFHYCHCPSFPYLPLGFCTNQILIGF